MARYNLTQIAHILQVLALSKWQEIDKNLNELIVKIPKKYCLKNFLQNIVQSEPKSLHSSQFNQSLFLNNLTTIANEIKRTCILFSENDLYYFLKMLFQVKNKTNNQYLKRVLDDFLKYLNEAQIDKVLNIAHNTSTGISGNHNESLNSDEHSTSNSESTSIKSQSSKKSILDKMTRRGKSQEIESQNHNSKENTKRSHSSKVVQNNNNLNQIEANQTDNSSTSIKPSFSTYNNLSLKNNNFQVLVLPILSNHNLFCSDILSEEKVLNIESLRKTRTKTKFNLDSNQQILQNVNTANMQQSQINLVANSLNNFTFCELDDKVSNVNSQISVDNRIRSKFSSLSQDQESIGTNDNLEAISEASSMENLNDNLLIEGDNLSDMISANVSSGRQTPNVSGRESSSSSSSSSDEDEPTAHQNDELQQPEQNQGNEQLENNQNQDIEANENQNNQNIDQHNQNQEESDRLIVQQRTHEYIEDKFGKYDYKQIVVTQSGADETKSVSHLSDTWSTDVLASLSSISLISSQLNDTNIQNQLSETINYEFCKKIFRHVFSIVDIQNIPMNIPMSKAAYTNFHSQPFSPSANSNTTSSNLNVQNRLTEVQLLLQLLLAESKHMQNLTNLIAIQEALRYLNNFDECLFNKMIQELKDDYQKRSPYIAYLVKCKQNLFHLIQHFQTIKCYLDQDKNTINNCLITFYVRKFFRTHRVEIENFVNKFKKLVLADEKANLIEEFLKELYSKMEQDSDWKYTNEDQMSYGKQVVERNIFSTIYFNALYPNGEGKI